jgi:MFS family permease
MRGEDAVVEGTSGAGDRALESRVGGKIVWRLVLPSALFILIGAIDRTNVGFAALQMNAELGLSGTQYGFGAGVLFVGYVLAKYPSVLLYEKLGMRRWLAAITLAWGCGACAMAAVTADSQLYALRLFIGFAEGGLSSGLMIYLSHWAPERYRATILAVPIMAIPIAQVVGAPVSGLLLDHAGWRVMFLAEAVPALLLGLFALVYFPDHPGDARWLAPQERDWLQAHVSGATNPKEQAGREGRWDALKSPVGWICALIWYCILASNYGVMFWLPQIVKGLSGLSATATGLIVALPNAASAVALVLNARHSDRTQERIFHIAVPALAGGCGLLAAFLLGPGLPGLLMLIVGGACTGCTVAAFWAIPTRLLPPRALAMGIVMINMFGSFAGATVPPAMGLLKERSGGSFLPPTLLLFGVAVLCAGLCLLARAPMRRAKAADT